MCLPTVLSLHKRPVAGDTDISFPKKGWMGTEDWARNSEDKVNISKSIVSSGNPGENIFEHILYKTHKIQDYVYMATTLSLCLRAFLHLSCILQSAPRNDIVERRSKSQVCFDIKEFLLSCRLIMPFHTWLCAGLHSGRHKIHPFALFVLFSFGANSQAGKDSNFGMHGILWCRNICWCRAILVWKRSH